jgi:FkbM family methyltransferase
MPRTVYDLSAHRRGGVDAAPLEHPAGVLLPFDGPEDAELIVPEIRSALLSGAYSGDLLQLLPDVVCPGDRILVIGAGFGVVSTVVARTAGVERVIAVEANTLLVRYLNRLHALNGVTGVETVNAVLANGKRGQVPFFVRQDPRDSSLLPYGHPWQKVLMVPFMDLNLILTEERISLIIIENPLQSARALSEARLDRVERVLVDCGSDRAAIWEEGELGALLSDRGYVRDVEPSGQTTMLFARPSRRAR